MKIALVYDRIVKFGGAERVLLALHEIWPEAPFYTAVYNPETVPWASVFEVKTSFLQHFPFASDRHELYPVLTPLVFESFDFSGFDVVLSITSADAKGIVTKPHTLHICYCLTPTRYLWSGYGDYLDEPGVGIFNPMARFFMKLFGPYLRSWDKISSYRPDVYIAISENVKKRIKKYYHREAKVIYPPVDTDVFHPSPVRSSLQDKPFGHLPGVKQSYFLIVSRLVPYKKLDYAIFAFNKLNLPLKIIGTGIDEKRLKKLANNNIEFLGGDLTDEKLCWYYQNTQALIFPGEEDFGITSLEAQACGKPVIAINSGGVKETIINGRTGIFYQKQTAESLIENIKKFNDNKYLSSNNRANALKFSKEFFKMRFKKEVTNLWWEHQKIIL